MIEAKEQKNGEKEQPDIVRSKNSKQDDEIRKEKLFEKIETVIIVNEKDKVNSETTTFGAPELSAIGAILTVLGSLTIAGVTVKKYISDQRLQKQQREDLFTEKAIEKAKEKIENFYGPINSLLEESRIIYEHFALEEKKQQQNRKRFRTLRHLTELPQDQSSGLDRFKLHDRELWGHILEISDKVINLIEKNSGYISNPALHTLLGKLAAHYRIVKSASNGSLKGQAEHLENVVFPLEVNGAINSEIKKLTTVIDEKVAVKVKRNSTIDYYDENYLEYYNKTIDSSLMKPVYELVLKNVDYGANILDAGSGVGRDTKYFIKRGFKVTSFDASKKMVEMCNEYPFAFCEHRDFETIQYGPEFDLVWACASLLHLSKDEFYATITKLHRALKNDGILYFSLKSKIDEEKSRGREFFVHDYSEVIHFMCSILKMKYINSWSSFSAISSTEAFENYIFKK